jgi:hypothetical protein
MGTGCIHGSVGVHGSLGSVLGEVEDELLFGCDEVGVVVVGNLDRDPVDLAGEGGA